MFDVDDLQVDSNDIDESFWLFLLPMTGTGWIHVSFAISAQHPPKMMELPLVLSVYHF